MNIQSILAVTDLSPAGNRTVFRAALLAVQHRALLKIMYAPINFATTSAVDARSSVAQLASEVAERFDVLVKQLADTRGELADVAEEARWADLLVIGDHRESSITALILGQPLERLQRTVSCPILVARIDASRRYRHIVVAVDFTPESRTLVKLAWALDTSAQVELFHALNTLNDGKLRYSDVSDEAVRNYRRASVLDARERLFNLTDSSTARRNRVASIGKGDAARQAVIQQQHSNADLLVVGKRRASALTDFLFGSVAQRVLQRSTRDVLIVPHDLRVASARAVVA